ncbi:MAG: histidine kinase, partial [Pseudolabrys sp.]
MRRRIKAGSNTVKTQRRKTLKRRDAPKAARGRSSLAANKETSAAQLARELKEAREQQTATADVLKVISTSPGELEPVFNAMLANATRICEATFGVLFLFEGDAWRAVALHGAAPPSFIEARRRYPVLPIVPGTALGRVTATKQ